MTWYLKLWLSLLVFWVPWVVIGALGAGWAPVIAATIVCGMVGIMVPALDLIWRPRR